MADDKHMVPITPAQVSASYRRGTEGDGRWLFQVTPDFSDPTHPLRPTLTDPAGAEEGDEDDGFLNERQEERISRGIKARMAELELSRGDVARALGVSTRTAGNYTNHPGKVPYLKALALARLLDMTPVALRGAVEGAAHDAVEHVPPVAVSDAYRFLLSSRDRARVDDMVLRLAGGAV